jgi:hypothetical protein
MKCILPGFEESAPEEQQRRLMAAFIKVFSSEEGKIVLNALLTDLKFFSQALTEPEKALNEYAKFFITVRLGVGNTLALTDAIAAEAQTAAGKRGQNV